MALAKHQKFEIQRVKRSVLREAPYNPREIDPVARERLRMKVRDAGLIETLVWNKRTGNLVSGHQRLSIMDELEGRGDYEMDVAVIDVGEKEEKELNVFLNNPAAQGQFDPEQLADLLREVDVQAAGFDDASLIAAVGDLATDLLSVREEGGVANDAAALNALKDKKKAARQQLGARDDAEFYLVLVFRSGDDVDAFLEGYGGDPQQRYLSGVEMAKRLGIDLDVAPDEEQEDGNDDAAAAP
jgi:hypothetical protein